jgi:hypothetical protein
MTNKAPEELRKSLSGVRNEKKAIAWVKKEYGDNPRWQESRQSKLQHLLTYIYAHCKAAHYTHSNCTRQAHTFMEVYGIKDRECRRLIGFCKDFVWPERVVERERTELKETPDDARGMAYATLDNFCTVLDKLQDAVEEAEAQYTDMKAASLKSMLQIAKNLDDRKSLSRLNAHLAP